MTSPQVRLRAPQIDYQSIRDELNIARVFPDSVQAAAELASTPQPPTLFDATDIELVTIDPPGSMDLDQALHVAALPTGGFRVHYAIADLAAFVQAGDPVDLEARRRGETLYSPDLRTPLHPPVLGEGAASLLPDVARPALLWRIDLDSEGVRTATDLRRATVRSRSRLDYQAVQASLDRGTANESLVQLRNVGMRRAELAKSNGAIDLRIPDQEVEVDGAGFRLVWRDPLPVEGWNAHISLLTGMAAADLMLQGGVGLLRTLPPADPRTVEALRHAAKALGVNWTVEESPATLIARLDPTKPMHAALLNEAAHLLRRAGYLSLDGAKASDATGHAGVGAPYAHVTAPIRRLCDRFASEVCVALAAGQEVPEWAAAALPDLPSLMAASSHKSHALERAVLDLTEAWLLQDHVGERFSAAVTEVDDHGAMIVLEDPPVRARCNGRVDLGSRLEVTLTKADIATRIVEFEVMP